MDRRKTSIQNQTMVCQTELLYNHEGRCYKTFSHVNNEASPMTPLLVTVHDRAGIIIYEFERSVTLNSPLVEWLEYPTPVRAGPGSKPARVKNFKPYRMQ